MGLDCFLRARQYISNNNIFFAKEAQTFEKLTKLLKVEERVSPDFKQFKIDFVVGYWQNRDIHNWFARNIMNDDVDGNEHSVSREQLSMLRTHLESVLENPSEADFHFPTTTQRSEYFPQIVQKLIQIIDNILEMPGYYEFYYHCSW